MRSRSKLTRYAWLAIGAALFTMALKTGAYFWTGSIGLLSDAAESAINLVAALLVLLTLGIAAQPPDEEHAYGHEKAEYFSSGVEGALILLAAVTITVQAVGRLLNPIELRQIDLGLLMALAASLVNLALARILIRVGRREQSQALLADGQHLMTDVWTSAAVLLGVGLVWVTGWQLLDPLVALAAAAHIAYSGFRLLRGSITGLMDTALPASEIEKIKGALEWLEKDGVRYHALRTRQAGARSFVSLHVQVPGDWSVQRGHDLMERVEAEIRSELPSAVVFTHIEPLEDPSSWRDEELDRPLPGSTIRHQR
ncbi:MAG: cation diffusion facilitator family transporter [Anaerolineales bacterium]